MKRILVILFAVIASHSYAQIPEISLTNVVDGTTISLSSYASNAGVIVIFTSNACPFDEHYRKRVNKLSKEFAGKIPLLLVNSYTDGNESAEEMAKKAQQLGIAVPYLADKDQTLMQSLKATKSPQAFLLKNTDGKFTVAYSGAIDDNAQVEADVRTSYLRDAAAQLVAGQTITSAEVRPVGCNIRRK
jgi:hypothetical protein